MAVDGYSNAKDGLEIRQKEMEDTDIINRARNASSHDCY